MVHNYVKIVIHMIIIISVVYVGFVEGGYFPVWNFYTHHPN